MRAKKVRNWTIVLIAFAVALVGCGGGALNSNHHSTDGGGTDGGGSGTTGGSGSTVSAKKGGAVHDALGKAVVVVPANALSSDTRIYIVPPTTSLPQAPEGLQLLPNTSYDLTPNGLYLNTAASLTLTYDPATLPAGMPETAVQIYTVSNDTWQPMPGCVVNTTYHTVSVPLPHFSVYAAMCARSLLSGPAYDVVDLGVLAGDSASQATGLSADGKVVGSSTSSAGGVRAFLWTNGVMADLNRRSGDIGARALAVNSSGLAGGASIVNAVASYPVLFSYGTVTQVATQYGMTGGAVTAINDAGNYVVGNAIVRSGSLTALTNFGAANGSGALNTNDEIAGYQGKHAAIWRPNGVVDAGVLEGYDQAVGTALSDDEALVGTLLKTDETARTGFVYRGGTMSTIPALDGDVITIPTGVNAVGQVVGYSSADGATSRGFLYVNGANADLNTLVPQTSGWLILQANAINNRGQIAATGYKSGAQHALLLNPRPGRSR